MTSPAMRAALDKIAAVPLRRAAWAAYPWTWADRRGEYDPTARLIAEDRQDARMDAAREAEWKREER